MEEYFESLQTVSVTEREKDRFFEKSEEIIQNQTEGATGKLKNYKIPAVNNMAGEILKYGRKVVVNIFAIWRKFWQY